MEEINSDKNDIKKEIDRQNFEIHLEKVKSIYKFHFFFVGLVFAIISFAIQFPIKNENIYFKIIEGSSWVVLSMSGMLALKEIGGFALNDSIKYYSGLNRGLRIVMWILFVIGFLLLLFSKIITGLVNI